MADFKFFIQRITKSEDSYIKGDTKDLEADFLGLHYKSIVGMETYGKPRNHVENLAEQEMALVDFPDEDTIVKADPLDQTDITLTLHFFCEDDTAKTKAEQIKSIDDSYHAFVSFISGCYCLYKDTARQRKVLMYRSEKIEPKTDQVKGLIYKEVEFKFKNVFGRSFPIDDMTIENIITPTL